MDKGLPLLLHVGCGGDPIPDWAEGKYKEVRLDISPDNQPDILASMTDMGDIGTYDALLCSHALEHLFPHEVPIALNEFRRVLNDKGFAIIFVPDLEDVKATEEVIMTDAPCGPLTGLDLIYGFRKVLHIMPYMAHKTGFTKETLEKELNDAGFSAVVVQRLKNYNLMAVVQK